jgi:sec-independent protein translocase protein TatC
MRKSLIISISILLVICNYFLSIKLLNYVVKNLSNKSIEILTITPFETIVVIFSFTGYFSLLMIMPLLGYLFYRNYEDALYYNERYILQNTLYYYLLGVIFSLIGFFLTVHITVPYLNSYNVFISLNNYVGLSFLMAFILQQTILFFLIALIPIIIRLLKKLEIIKNDILKKYQKHVYVGIFIICAFLTPADIVSTFVMSVPMFIMYRVSI